MVPLATRFQGPIRWETAAIVSIALKNGQLMRTVGVEASDVAKNMFR